MGVSACGCLHDCEYACSGSIIIIIMVILCGRLNVCVCVGVTEHACVWGHDNNNGNLYVL